MPAFFTSERFIKKYGRSRLLWFRKALSDGMPQWEIAMSLELSEARVSQLIKILFRPEYKFADGTSDALRFALSTNEHEADEIRSALSDHGDIKEGPLRLLRGKRP